MKCGQYLMFGVLISKTCENYGNYSCKYSHGISSSWVVMLVVAKEQSCCSTRLRADVCWTRNSVPKRSEPRGSLSFWFIYLSVIILLIVMTVRSHLVSQVVCASEAERSSSSLSLQSSSLWWQKLDFAYSGSGPGQFSFVFFSYNQQDGGCRYQKQAQSLTLPLEMCHQDWVVFSCLSYLSVWWPL